MFKNFCISPRLSTLGRTYSTSRPAHEVIIQKRLAEHPSLISRFVNVLMKTGGDKPVVEKHVAYGLQLIQQKTNQRPEELFAKAVEMISPMMHCGSMKRGSKKIRIPIPLTEKMSTLYAFKWLTEALRKKREPRVPLEERFAQEILSILEGRSSLLSKRAQLHKDALVNRSNAQFRWPVGSFHLRHTVK